MPDTALSTQQEPHLIFTTLWGSYYYYPQDTDGKLKFKGLSNLPQVPQLLSEGSGCGIETQVCLTLRSLSKYPLWSLSPSVFGEALVHHVCLRGTAQ